MISQDIRDSRLKRSPQPGRKEGGSIGKPGETYLKHAEQRRYAR